MSGSLILLLFLAAPLCSAGRVPYPLFQKVASSVVGPMGVNETLLFRAVEAAEGDVSSEEARSDVAKRMARLRKHPGKKTPKEATVSFLKQVVFFFNSVSQSSTLASVPHQKILNFFRPILEKEMAEMLKISPRWAIDSMDPELLDPLYSYHVAFANCNFDGDENLSFLEAFCYFVNTDPEYVGDKLGNSEQWENSTGKLGPVLSGVASLFGVSLFALIGYMIYRLVSKRSALETGRNRNGRGRGWVPRTRGPNCVPEGRNQS